MSWVRLPVLTIAIVLLAANVARAADYPQPPTLPVYQPPPPTECCAAIDNWYLRGFVGIGMMHSNQVEYLQNPANADVNFSIDHSSIGNASFVGAGIGYEWNNWLRFDVTGEYRSKAQVNAFGHYTTFCTPGYCLDTYQGYVSSWVFLANAYVDLGTWWCFTPFVGAGIGATRNSMSDFTDIGIPTAGTGLGLNTSEWHAAWALHAGVAYNVSKNLKIELAYRYLNLGSITETIACTQACAPDSYRFSNLYSHDIMLGLRWTCCETAPPPQNYVYTPPSQQYVPPPTYQQPLRSRG